MASKRTTKRRSPCQDTIFLEVNDNDLSPEHQTNEDIEPESKIMKTDLEFFTKESFENFNLENENSIFNEKVDKESTNETIPYVSEEFDNVPMCNERLETQSNTKCNENVDISHKELEDGEVCDIASNRSSDIPDSRISSDSTIQISFSNKELADLYKFKFIKFLESFVELEVANETDLSITFQRDNLLNSSEWVIVDETFCSDEIAVDTVITQNTDKISQKSKKKKGKKKKRLEEKKIEEDLFVVDTNPSQNEHNFNTLRYSSTFEIDFEKKDENEQPKKIVSNQSCFNCGGNHSLRDCKVPRNASRINAERNKFKVQKQGVRYHLEEDQKYGHLTPGKISNALREALGLRKNELPRYIYQMRVLGYPPGWLEEAKFFYSNLDMFDGEGKTVRQKSKKKQGLNPEKIIDYPGFNVPTEKYIKDEYYMFRNIPPYSNKFSKEAMIEFFEKQFVAQQDDYDDCEMDLDANENAVEEVKINPIIKELKDTTELCLPSPSLVELEKQKENLLLALEDNTSSNIISEDNTSEAPEKISLFVQDNLDSESQDDDNIKLIRVEDCIDLDNSTDEGISDSEKSFSSCSAIKTSVLGTPILKSNSPYSRLPKMDNFTKDVSPVINFENLPNSTGKYEQMTGVLQKVRTQMKHLQNS